MKLIGTTLALAFTAAAFTGCQTSNEQAAKPASPAAPSVSAAPAATPAPAAIRIKAGSSAPITDSSSNLWLADKGFADGDVIERPDISIENTKDPAIYRAERYAMTKFEQPLPNGTYTVKLHFAETFEGIAGPGDRVFSFNVEGKEFKDFDIWAKSGGALRAYVETVKVNVTDGKLDITFTPNVENPAINGIEILPGS